MIHPHTELKFINEVVGYGVFASRDIPEGTITYVKDSLEIVINPNEFLLQSKEMQEVIDKYSYIDEAGNRIMSWDFAKYVNHCCMCNTISTGYGFEIAIRDIKAGEQITDEYGIFNIESEMELTCQESCCRKRITPRDFELHYQEWDLKIKAALEKFFDIDQPLLSLIDSTTKAALMQYQKDKNCYKSVYALKYHASTKLNGQAPIFV